MKFVRDMYDDLALITGFPIYTNDTDKPDTDRFILHCLSEGLQNVIDNIYINNNVTERTDIIVTNENEQEYGIDGVVKNLQLIRENGSVKRIPYLDKVNKDMDLSTNEVCNYGEPRGYVIRKGYIKLYPIPNKEYKLKATLSTKNLILSNNDAYKTQFTDINDALLADNQFCDLVVLRSAVLIFTRAQSPNAQIYSEICNKRMRDYIERDYKSTEAQRGYERNAGHYRSDRGLLD